MIILCIKPFSFGHGFVELRFEALVGLLYSFWCRLPIKLRGDRLARRQSRQWISRRLANGRLELRNFSGTGTGVSRR